MKKTNKKNGYVFGQKVQGEKIYKTFAVEKLNAPSTLVKVEAGDVDLYGTSHKNYYVEMTEPEAIAYRQFKTGNQYFQAGVLGYIDVITKRNEQLVKDVHALYETYPLPLSDALSGVFFAERFMHDMVKHQIDVNEVMQNGVAEYNAKMAGKTVDQLTEEFKVK